MLKKSHKQVFKTNKVSFKELSYFKNFYLNFGNKSLKPLSVDSMALPSLYIEMVFQIRINFYLMNGLIDYYYY